MSEKERKYSDNDEQFENRGGKKDGSTPDYEKQQSPAADPKEFDNSKTSW